MMRLLLSAIALISLSVAGCTPGPDFTAGCKTDSDCDASKGRIGFFCDTGVCKCRTDDPCGEGYVCNDFGKCQQRPRCLANDECETDFICYADFRDPADPCEQSVDLICPRGGKCIPDTQCGSSAQCQYGEYCQKECVPDDDLDADGRCDPDTETCKCAPTEDSCEKSSDCRFGAGECVPGCRNAGDCRLGSICIAGVCTPGRVGDDCQICPANPNPDASFCEYGERCDPMGNCVSHTAQADLCSRCGGGIQCPAGTKCLLDNESCSCIGGKCYPTGEACNTAADCTNPACNVEYCSPECVIDADCPNGYSGCGSIINVCGSCSTGDPNCPAGTSGGHCVLAGGESDQGWCTCTEMFCTLLGKTYVEHESLGSGYCEDPIKSCGKESGMLCEDMITTCSGPYCAEWRTQEEAFCQLIGGP